MEDHLAQMEDLIDQLASLREELAVQLTVALFLSGLPDSYSAMITARETRPEADLTIELVKNKSMNPSVEIIQLLLDNGACTDHRDYFGQTPLSLAAGRKCHGVLDLNSSQHNRKCICSKLRKIVSGRNRGRIFNARHGQW